LYAVDRSSSADDYDPFTRYSLSHRTAASVMFYLNHIVAPYVMFLRVARQDPALMVYLVMDNDGEEEE
jgi:hypothetical protein